MAQIFLNNCYATLAQAITATDTQIELSGMNGFPASVGVGDFFLLTLYADDSRYGSNIEVVKVTGLSGATLTVERGYEEGAFAHAAGERVEARLTATTLDRIDQPNDWPSITNKPTEFLPVAHGHTWAEVTSKPNTATRWPTWNEVEFKPTVFAPSNHSHNASDITSGTLNRPLDIPFYSLEEQTTTQYLYAGDYNSTNCYIVDIRYSSETLYFNQSPPTGNTKIFTIKVLGNNTVSWPVISWDGGAAPELNASWTMVTLYYSQGTWYGFKSGGAD